MTYGIRHDDVYVARVQIDDAKATRAAIKEMVEFWAFWQSALERDGGDYTRCWLRKLGQYILHNGKPPGDEEGWYLLDGSKGIKLLDYWPWQFDSDETSIVEVGE